MSKYILPRFLFFAFCLSSLVSAGIVHVPQDQASIQSGINAAVNGDTVLVADSTYYENINFNGKAITVASYMIMDNDSTHRDSTIINGSQPTNPDIGSVVSFVSGEDTNSVIYGFTITGGTGTLYNSNLRVGGGIHCGNSGARISHNKIIFNSVTNNQICNGGGIGHYPLNNVKHVIIEDNIIASNALNSLVGGMGGSTGGGIFLTQGKIIHNKIFLNTSTGQTLGSGGGIHVHCDTTYGRTFVRISGNTITNNHGTSANGSSNGGGIDVAFTNVEIDSNQISHNTVSGIYPYGCGVRVGYSRETSVVKDNTISYNSYINQGGTCYGGGLEAENTIGLTIEGNHFYNNIAFNWGGGICDLETRGSVISDNEFIANESDSINGAGGGVGCYLSNNITITRNLFKHNSAWGGGGLISGNSNLLLTNNLFTQNKASEGGAIFVSQIPPLPVLKNKIINNTIIENIADIAGGIELEAGLELVLLNSICHGNNAAFAPEIYIKDGIMDIAYSDIRFGADSIEVGSGGVLNWLDGNINADPQFVVGDSLCHLPPNPSNPCVNTGADSIQINGQWYYCPPDDYEGDERPYLGRLPDMGADETQVPVGIELQPIAGIPGSYALSQNYPNPFNPTTTIGFSLPRSGFVTLEIYNILGEKVSTLVSKHLTVGNYKYEWDAKEFASGFYFYRLQTSGFVKTRKMLLIR